MYFDVNGKLRSMATSWTDLVESDVYQEMAAGSSWFRFDDLLTLAEMLTVSSEARRSKRRGVK